MALFADKLEALTDQLEQLNARERLMVAAVSICAVLFIGFMGNYLINNSLSRAKADNKELLGNLERILQKRNEYIRARNKVRKLERQIAQNPVDLLIFLDRTSKKIGVSIASMTNVSPPNTAKAKRSRIKEKIVRIEMNAVPLAALAKFLEAIENTGQKLVKVKTMSLKPNFSAPSKPDIIAQIAAYELRK